MEDARLLTALDVAKKLANVGGIDRWATILQEWLNSYTDRWKAEEQLRAEEIAALRAAATELVEKVQTVAAEANLPVKDLNAMHQPLVQAISALGHSAETMKKAMEGK